MFNIKGQLMQRVTRQLFKQSGALEELTSKLNPMTSALEEHWKGPDAQEFLNEFQRDYLTKIMNLIAAIAGGGSSLGAFGNIIQSADMSNLGRVEGVRGVVKFFKG